MGILNTLSHKLKKDEIVLKNSKEKSPPKNKQKEKKSDKPEELSLSLIKENSDNSIIDLDKNNNMEISIVQLDKLEETEKDIVQLKTLINKCESDIQYIKSIIHRFKNSTNELIMESGVFNDKSMVFINKKEEEENSDINVDNTENKIDYFKRLKDKFTSLKNKLESILGLYESEKELSLIKKNELDKLNDIKNEYNQLKQSIQAKSSKKF